MPKYVSYDEMMEILDNKYLLPFRKDERLRGLSGIDIVRCKECKHKYLKDMSAYCPHRVGAINAWGFCDYGEREER